jgi:hypothetical protein
MSIKKHLIYIYYSDIQALELFQSALLILVNPLNLISIKCSKHDIDNYLLTLAISCALVGILNIIYIFIHNLKQRLNVARLHLVVTLTTCLFLMHCKGINVNISLVIYYWVQTITCLFVGSRLYLEVAHKQKVSHGK